LDDTAHSFALKFLEEKAIAENGLDVSGFFCLQQAILLVNGKSRKLTLQNSSEKEVSADKVVSSDIQTSGKVADIKLSNAQLVGSWMRIRHYSNYVGGQPVSQEMDYKVALMGKWNSVAETFDCEFIDETRDSKKLFRFQGSKMFEPVPPLLEQKPLAPNVMRVRNAEQLEGIKGLWACALGGEAGSDNTIADLAASLLLSLHQGNAKASTRNNSKYHERAESSEDRANNVKALLRRIQQEMRSPSGPLVVGRCLGMLEAMVDLQPLTRRRRHIGCGFPLPLKIESYEWVQGEERWVTYGNGVTRKEARQIRRRTFSKIEHFQSQTTMQEFHEAIADLVKQKSVELEIKDKDFPQESLSSSSHQTLEEIGLVPYTTVEAEALSYHYTEDLAPGPLDDIFVASDWPETLLGILDSTSSSDELSEATRARCWHLLRRLPTYEAFEKHVTDPASQAWSEHLSRGRIWHTIYYVLLIEAFTDNQIHTSRKPALHRAESSAWLKVFKQVGGNKALLDLMEASSSLGDLERSALLPVLARTIHTIGVGAEVDMKAAANFWEQLFLRPDGLSKIRTNAAQRTFLGSNCD
jgi:hypothetical protein